MIEIAVGSQNPGKLEAVRLGFEECLSEPFQVTGYVVGSGVSDQPMSDEEMILGARNRAQRVQTVAPNAHYRLGMEGGIRDTLAGWFNLGWVCVIDKTSNKEGYGITPAHHIPVKVRKLMEERRMELSDAVAAIYKSDTVTDRDCSGVITDGLLPADLLYKIGVIAAFADARSL